MIKIRLVSLIRARASWAHVARKLCEALQARGAAVMIEEDDDGTIDDAIELGAGVRRALATRLPDPDVDLLIVRPERFAGAGRARLRTGIMVFEADVWPPAWVEQGRAHLHTVLTPSGFCRDTLVASGGDAARIEILPHGIDPDLFFAEPLEVRADLRRLLFVGTPVPRKGLLALVEALAQMPLVPGRASLTIKTECWPGRPGFDAAVAEGISAVQRRGIEVAVLDEALSEARMGDLYRAHDILCAPHQGEGFGMCVLEAMACGRPVVATAWSGVTDFFDHDAGWPLADFAPVAAAQLLPASFGVLPEARMVAPSRGALTAALTAALSCGAEDLARLGQAAAAKARELSWVAAADRFLSIVTRLQSGMAR